MAIKIGCHKSLNPGDAVCVRWGMVLCEKCEALHHVMPVAVYLAGSLLDAGHFCGEHIAWSKAYRRNGPDSTRIALCADRTSMEAS